MKPVFVDTTGWYCLLNRRESRHEAAQAVMRKLARSRTSLVTTDYVVDETATLIVARRAPMLLEGLFRLIEASQALTVTPVGTGRFREACSTLLKHRDQGYSFTDVTSFIVMRELGLVEVLTDDLHFEKAGFRCLLRGNP